MIHINHLISHFLIIFIYFFPNKMSDSQNTENMTREEMNEFFKKQMEGTMNLMENMIEKVNSTLSTMDEKVDELKKRAEELQKKKQEGQK